MPLQTNFTSEMLRSRDFTSGRSKELTERLDQFVHAAFGCNEGADAEEYPELENIFTNIDLSANSGHYLGESYGPSSLRMTRRILISRIIRMLGKSFEDGKKKSPQRRSLLEKLLQSIDGNHSQFISLNWDTVLESMYEEIKSPFSISYGNGTRQRALKAYRVANIRTKKKPGILLCKMHGSVNWLYCENCRRVFSFPPNSWTQIAAQVLKPEEQIEIYKKSLGERILCPACPEVDLGIRLATFSFQKALNFPMFDYAWQEANKALNRANKWVFIGYSLPAADFHFKFLLKRSQLARRRPPEIHLVSGGEGAEATAESYRKFFGREHLTEHLKGLSATVIAQITS